MAPKAFRLVRCLTCGCEAHARFEYTLEKNQFGEPTCRACHWAAWVATGLSMGAQPEEAEYVDPATARTHADAHGYDYLGPAPIPPAQRVQCRYCGRISAERMGDIAWGCSCQVNAKRAAITHTAYVAAVADDGEIVSSLNPELVEQWHPTKNLPITLRKVTPGSRRQIHWREPSCGHEWTASPAEREKRQRLRCPECRTILDSLAWHFPDVAAEWSPDNPLSAWHVRPSGATNFVPEWVCSTNPTHRWRMPTQIRVNGSTCPECRESGKSMVELRYFEAVRTEFGEALSGVPMRHEAFTRRSSWTPDVTVLLEDGRTLVVEYDGAYWHADKGEVDRAKTRDLLASGALVVRLREAPLPTLGLTSPRYLEVEVSSSRPDPAGALVPILTWLSALSTDRSEDDDGLGVPNCPLHLVPLEPVGDAVDGRDARWICPEPGCGWVQVA